MRKTLSFFVTFSTNLNKKTDSEKHKAVTLSNSFSVLASKNVEADKAILLGMYTYLYCPWNFLITVEGDRLKAQAHSME